MNVPYSDDDHGDPNAGLPIGQGPSSMEISVETADRIEAVLAALVDDVQLDFAAVLDDSGAVLGWAAASDHSEAIADSESGGNAAMVEMMVDCSGALAMGAFAASQTLAAQLGGEASREMIHHAGSKSFHLTEISAGVALFSVWSEAVALGYLRDSARRAVKLLQGEICNVISSASSTRTGGGPAWQSPLLDYPSGPAAVVNGAEKRFPMASGAVAAREKDERYVFEIG